MANIGYTSDDCTFIVYQWCPRHYKARENNSQFYTNIVYSLEGPMMMYLVVK